MNETLEVLQAEALKLSAPERSRLLECLIASLDTVPVVDAAWEEEADRREAELESAAVKAVPIEDAIARLRARLGR